VERRKDAAAAGSGDLIEQHTISYKDSSSASDLEKGRVDIIESDDATSGTAALQTKFDYATANTNGQQVTVTDQKRGIATVTEYDSYDRPIHTTMSDPGGYVTPETWTGYDASGRVVYSAHKQGKRPHRERYDLRSARPSGRVAHDEQTRSSTPTNSCR